MAVSFDAEGGVVVCHAGGRASRTVESGRIRTIAVIEGPLFDGLVLGISRSCPLWIRRHRLSRGASIEGIRDELVRRANSDASDRRRIERALERGRLLQELLRPPKFLLTASLLVLAIYAAKGPVPTLRLFDRSALFGSVIPGLVLRGQLDRLVTANLLHQNFAHCWNNVESLLLFGVMAEAALGSRRLFALGLTSGVVAYAVVTVLIVLVHPSGTASTTDTYGGSTVVSAAAGATLCLFARRWRAIPGARWFAPLFGWGFFRVFVLVGNLTIITQLLHDTALVIGFAATWVMQRSGVPLPLPRLPRSSPWFVSCATAVVVCLGISFSNSGEATARAYASLFCEPARSRAAEPDAINDCSWAIAASPYAGEASLAGALESMQALTSQSAESRYRDTLALLYERTGDIAKSLEIRRDLWRHGRDAYSASQLARVYAAQGLPPAPAELASSESKGTESRWLPSRRSFHFAGDAPPPQTGFNVMHVVVYVSGEIFGLLELPFNGRRCEGDVALRWWQPIGELSAAQAWAGFDEDLYDESPCVFRVVDPAIERLPPPQAGTSSSSQQRQ